MLDMGFIHAIRRLVGKMPRERQTLFFSATMPPAIKQLASSILRNPVGVQVAPVSATADKIEQSVFMVERRNKPALLAHLYHNAPISRGLVFVRTKHGADRLVKHLQNVGIRTEAIHGNKSQNARQRALLNFRNGKTALLVASDVAARGIDVDGISHVVNFDLTHEPETYVHRIGRTARAGASGVAISFCDGEERSNLRAIEKLIRKTIPVRTDHPTYSAQAATHGGPSGRAPDSEDRPPQRAAYPRPHQGGSHQGGSHKAAAHKGRPRKDGGHVAGRGAGGHKFGAGKAGSHKSGASPSGARHPGPRPSHPPHARPSTPHARPAAKHPLARHSAPAHQA
jgi:ATP-dependent RNA helicase RhlE